MSIVFRWSPEQLDNLVATCDSDGVFPLVERYVPKGSRVLESGCGAARYVRYLKDRGWDITGLELSSETVGMVKRHWPDLDIFQGDAANSAFDDGSFDAVISLGVVEHWHEGPHLALREIYRLLRPGGIAIVTVPCFNSLRRFKHRFCIDEITSLPRALVARVLRKRPMQFNRLQRRFRFAVYPSIGPFFEYRMTTTEFAAEVRGAGLSPIAHQSLGEIDGFFADLNLFGLLVRFRDHRFYTSAVARQLNGIFSRWPFFHCHLQAVVARRPEKTTN